MRCTSCCRCSCCQGLGKDSGERSSADEVSAAGLQSMALAVVRATSLGEIELDPLALPMSGVVLLAVSSVVGTGSLPSDEPRLPKRISGDAGGRASAGMDTAGRDDEGASALFRLSAACFRRACGSACGHASLPKGYLTFGCRSVAASRSLKSAMRVGVDVGIPSRST